MNINDLPILMLRSLICTITIEITIGLILKIRNKRDIINIVLVNILTNPLVTSIPIFILLKYGSFYSKIIFVILEIFALFVEGFIYKIYFKYKKINPFIISLILNSFSYIIGEIINRIF